ncbi:hypothetical protein EV421DRAFT_1742475 [Armillaria borealis]|uniref:Uncharacterized protein n=1 Tax=Armillaria borealis TaxID=47425 RepID=A0AA39IZ21_9AGAR|nr:hypothetical protein EV421DRAFT_1742475 [Armillaria borealis]
MGNGTQQIQDEFESWPENYNEDSGSGTQTRAILTGTSPAVFRLDDTQTRQRLSSPMLAVPTDRRTFPLAGGTSSHSEIYALFLQVLEREQRMYMLSLIRLLRLSGSRRLPPLILNGDKSRSPHCLFSQLRMHNSCAQIPRIKENGGAPQLYSFIGETGSQARLQYSFRLPYFPVLHSYRIRSQALSPLFDDLIRKTQGRRVELSVWFLSFQEGLASYFSIANHPCKLSMDPVHSFRTDVIESAAVDQWEIASVHVTNNLGCLLG